MPEGAEFHRHRATRAIQRMVEFAPSTGGLALWVRHEDVAGDDAPPATTDGNTVRYGAAFEALHLYEQTGLVAHEVLHVALRHPQRFLDLKGLLGDVDLEIFNICADAIVNSTLGHLNWLRLPAGAVFLDQLLAGALDVREDVETSLLGWDVERLYRAIDDRRARDDGKRQRSGSGGEANGKAPGDAEKHQADRTRAEPTSDRARADGPRAMRARALGALVHVDLTPSEGAREAPEAEADQTRERSERLLRGHVQDGMFSMLRVLIADLPGSRTPWEQILRTQLARGLSRKPAVSWSRPTRSYIANQGRGGANRRLPWEPGFGPARAAPHLAVIVDVSGSIKADMMERFAREVEAIARRQEADLVLIIGDDRIRRVEKFEPGRADLRKIAFRGGGATDFTPLLEGANEHRPDIAVVLTDLDGPANFRPHWPVIWAVPATRADAIAPFGRKVILKD